MTPAAYHEFMAVCKAVSEHYRVSVADMRGPSKLKWVYTPRAVAMFLIREKYNTSYPEIGRFFARDHSTAILAVRAVPNEVAPTDLAQIRARIENKPVEGCHRCNQLMTELAALKIEVLEMRARLNGCG